MISLLVNTFTIHLYLYIYTKLYLHVCVSRRFSAASSNGAAARNNNQGATGTSTAGSSSRAPQRPRGRVVRAVGRGRGSGVIVGSRPLLPASVVPEELVSQVLVLYNLLNPIL